MSADKEPLSVRILRRMLSAIDPQEAARLQAEHDRRDAPREQEGSR